MEGPEHAIHTLKVDAVLRRKAVTVIDHALRETAKEFRLDMDDITDALTAATEAVVADTKHTTIDELLEVGQDAAETFLMAKGVLTPEFAAEMHAKSAEPFAKYFPPAN